MNHNALFPLIVFLLPVLPGCFQAEKKKELSSPVAYAAGSDAVPAPLTPSEAVRQLLEGNSRFAHHERRWQHLSSSQAPASKPFALVLNADSGNIAPEEIFDLPKGSVPVLTWRHGETDWKALEDGVRSSVKVVLVLLPFRAADWTGVTTASITSGTGTLHAVQAVTRRLHARSSILSRAIAEGRCHLISVVLHPETRRVITISSFN